MNDLDDLLAGGEAPRHLGTDGPLSDPSEQARHHVDVDVGFEQGEANLPESRIDVVGGQAPLGAQPIEDAAQVAGEGLEHGSGA